MFPIKLIFLLLVLPAMAQAADCPEPKSVADFVDCQNHVLASGRAMPVSAYIAALVSYGSLACTKSRASAQPAAPDRGDLRCFLRFPSNTTVSVNLLEGLNHDDIEVSEVYAVGNDSGAIMGRFNMLGPVRLGDVVRTVNEPLFGSRMTCMTCHPSVTDAQVDLGHGLKAWLVTPIHFNETVRGTVPMVGQVSPEDLDAQLHDLMTQNHCTVGSFSETCERIRLLLTAPDRYKLDNPQE